ncbi:pro-resilin-like [Artemia franciscana]|uniref:Cuticle protein n=1 Tax=Artemia franciscana TaxID=6661 RepID=A0AA88KS41_ARTSF|nr:hypothetical protein QYM36_017629 [Artemia franciscana]
MTQVNLICAFYLQSEKIMKTILLLASGLSVVFSRPQYSYDRPPSGLYELPEAPTNQVETRVAPPSAAVPMPMPYELDWAVSDQENGLDFGHEEASSDGIVSKGSYKVLLPDGRLQVVTFTVNGDDGYVANVQYQK